MSQFSGILKHEFNMSIRRKGLWISHAVVLVFFGWAMLSAPFTHPSDIFAGGAVWCKAGEMVYLFNMLLPLVVGVLAADRLQRDVRLNMRELQGSTPLKRPVYILGKYFGVLLSCLVPTLVGILVMDVLAVAIFKVGLDFVLITLLAFVAIDIPSYIFVVAISLAFPLIIPLRVYQILFTGYWFWGNFLSNEAFPTISGTRLTSNGVIAEQGFFRGEIGKMTPAFWTPLDALINTLILVICATAAMIILERLLTWQTKQA